MAITPKKNHIAYRCPDCGDVIHGFVGQIHANMLRIKCPCEKSALEVHFRDDKKVRFSIPCVFCKSNHTYVVSESIVFGRDLFLLSCPYANMDIAFLGEEERVGAEVERAEGELVRLLNSLEAEHLSDIQPEPMAEEEILPDPELYDIVRFLVRELEADGKVDCPCHSVNIDFRFTDAGVEIYCMDCGARYEFPATSVAVARESLDLDEIKLS